MTADKTNLGRLEPVELKSVWNGEATDFTPWLAKEDNLALLGDTIGLELELEAQEKNVGPFRADILCKDTASNDWVLIENQLERTDHTHLGQLMTYAAGLKAVTIVWIANRFTEEHRAALDWLNEITSSQFNFFGLEVELWQIGQSAVAPKFNVACKPNEWTKGGGPTTVGDLTKTQQAQLDFWGELREVMSSRRGVVKSVKPQAGSWLNFGVGKGGFCLSASMHSRDHWVCVSLQCYSSDAKAHFGLLMQEKEAIESEVGSSLEWDKRASKKSSYIGLYQREVNPLDRSRWPEPQQWIAEKLEAFHKAFSPRVKELNADDYEPPDEE